MLVLIFYWRKTYYKCLLFYDCEICIIVISICTFDFTAQSGEAVEVLHTYDSMKDDTQELASQYPDIAIYSEQGMSTGLELEIFSVDVALNITELTDEELNALPTMYVDGTHHGNEGMSAEASFRSYRTYLKEVLQILHILKVKDWL